VLTALRDAIHVPGPLKRLAKQWKDRRKQIDTLGDLLSCYFSSVRIVCIPRSDKSPHWIYDQYRSLYTTIEKASLDSKKRREQSGMLFSSPEMQQYLRAAFEHFCTHADKPFNFLRATARNNRLKKTFEDHITEAAILFVEKQPQIEGKQLSSDLARLVASSMLLNATRLLLPGRCEFRLPLGLGNLNYKYLTTGGSPHRFRVPILQEDLWKSAQPLLR